MDFVVFKFELIAKDELYLPLYKGSAFRGLFGHTLKRTVCITNMAHCENCELCNYCAYAYIFETKNMRGEKIAHPFILEPPLLERRIFHPGDILKVNVVLLGKAIEYLPYIVYTFREMGKKGIGRNRGKFWLQRVSKDGRTIYDCQEPLVRTEFDKQNLFKVRTEITNSVKIKFITPTAIKVNGRVSKDIDFVILFKALNRRLKALSVYHNGKTEHSFDKYLAKASLIKMKSKALEPYNWKRYSSRQSKMIQFNGFIGSVEFEGDMEPFMQLLKIGEIIHIGRGTVYGMGKYIME